LQFSHILYNIFVFLNMKQISAPRQISSLLRALSQPARLEILLAIGTGEACVCHLETATGQRQAYISQQLMALRRAKIVASRREGRNIYYRLRDPAVLELIQQAGDLIPIQVNASSEVDRLQDCPCPNCSTVGNLSELG
jgi:DNA-binding transcriptional ArsR family regulator